MTMAASLEARVPLLNNDLLGFVSSLPTNTLMPGGKTKELLRSALARHLPKRILKKPKKGFGPPSAAWTRGVFAETLKNLFNRERLDRQGVLVFEEVQRLMAEHQSRKADRGRLLWALLSFQLRYDRFCLKEEFLPL